MPGLPSLWDPGRLAPPICVDDICQVRGLTGPEPTHQIAGRSAPRLRTLAHSTRRTCRSRSLLSWMPKKKNIASSDSRRNGCGRRIGRESSSIGRVCHGSENSRVRIAYWRWPRVRRNDCRSEFRFDPRGSPGQLSARPNICSSGEQMRGVRGSYASPKVSAGSGIRRERESLHHGRAGGEMSAGPGVRRTDKSLRVGAITLDQRHRARNGEISGSA